VHSKLSPVGGDTNRWQLTLGGISTAHY